MFEIKYSYFQNILSLRSTFQESAYRLRVMVRELYRLSTDRAFP